MFTYIKLYKYILKSREPDHHEIPPNHITSFELLGNLIEQMES